jgi:hypothetical protein
LLPSTTIAPGVDVWMAMLRFDPDSNAATTGPVISTLKNPLAGVGNSAAGIAASNAGLMVGRGTDFWAKVSVHGEVTACTVSCAAVLDLIR